MRLVLHVKLWYGLLSITTSVSLLANKLHVRSILHGQVSLAAVNHVCVIHEVMNSCKNKGLLRKCKYLFLFHHALAQLSATMLTFT